MSKARKNRIDPDDHSKWGHRFEFRDRSKTPRDIVPALPPPVKKRVQAVIDTVVSSDSELPDSNINAFDFKPEPESTIPIQLPRAKTQTNRKHKQPAEPRKKKKVDVELIVRDIVNNLLD